jgi:hypothetical protein
VSQDKSPPAIVKAAPIEEREAREDGGTKM